MICFRYIIENSCIKVIIIIIIIIIITIQITNDITRSINCKYRTPAKLYTLETLFVSGI